MKLFEPLNIGRLELPNRIIRTATFEGMADPEGNPGSVYIDFYRRLAAADIGLIICGFAFVSSDGRAMQPGQAGIADDSSIPYWTRLCSEVHAAGGRIALQLAHAGRQTSAASLPRGLVRGISGKRSPYFRSRPRAYSTDELHRVAGDFARAADRARKAGFDAVQLHAAHGYLLHQSLHPGINTRKDEYGVDHNSGIGTGLLEEVISETRKLCGPEFPVLVKISADDDLPGGAGATGFEVLIRFLDQQPVDGIEISYGSMEMPLNIFRGDAPLDLILDHNPRYRLQGALKRRLWKLIAAPVLRKKILPFRPAWNLDYARQARKLTGKTIISVGGFRHGREMEKALVEESCDSIGVCRPFICEPDFAVKLKERSANYRSKCTNCNFCAILCDTHEVSRCSRRQV
ncbi:NADH:flavin oxidoreductase [Spirochaeta dissipatitropha]